MKILKMPLIALFNFFRIIILMACVSTSAFAAPPDFTGIWERRAYDGSHRGYYALHQQGDMLIVIELNNLSSVEIDKQITGNIEYISYIGWIKTTDDPGPIYQYGVRTKSFASYLYPRDYYYYTFSILFKSEDEADTVYGEQGPGDDDSYQMVRIFH